MIIPARRLVLASVARFAFHRPVCTAIWLPSWACAASGVLTPTMFVRPSAEPFPTHPPNFHGPARCISLRRRPAVRRRVLFVCPGRRFRLRFADGSAALAGSGLRRLPASAVRAGPVFWDQRAFQRSLAPSHSPPLRLVPLTNAPVPLSPLRSLQGFFVQKRI